MFTPAFRTPNVDVLQNYAGLPNGRRFPTFFSLDAQVYRDFHLHLPFTEHGRRHKVRVGLYSINLTNHGNFMMCATTRLRLYLADSLVFSAAWMASFLVSVIESTAHSHGRETKKIGGLGGYGSAL